MNLRIGLIQTTAVPKILAAGDSIIAIDADGNSATPNAAELVANILDGNSGTKYLNTGIANSGFIVTPAAGASVVQSFAITTANDVPSRDPASYQLYGTNAAISSTANSTGTAESWTLIQQGSLSLPSARQTTAAAVSVTNSVS